MNTFVITVKDGFKEKAFRSATRSMGLKISKNKLLAKPVKESNYTRPGKPISFNQYKNRIKEARQMVEEGDFTSHDDLKKEFGFSN